MCKKIILVLLMVGMLMSMTSCGEKTKLHCDKCGKEVEVDKNSKMKEDWIIFCDECGDIDLK